MDCEEGAPFGLKLTLASASFSRKETESTLTSMACMSTFLATSLSTPSFTASGVSMFFEQPARHSAARKTGANFTYRLYPPWENRRCFGRRWRNRLWRLWYAELGRANQYA